MKTTSNQFRLSSQYKNFSFGLKRAKGHFFNYIVNRLRWKFLPRFQYVSKFPSHVDIEISSICDLNCPMCYTTTDEFKEKVNRGLMEMKLFKKLVDECAENNLYSIRTHARGEPFLNPDAIEMIKYAKEKGIKEVSSLTHGGHLDEEKFEKLIDIGLDWLSISIDGVGETYDKIRAPLKFDEMVNKLKRFKEIKKERGVIKPIIKVQTVWPAIEKNPEEYFKIFDPITDQVASNPLIDWLFKDDEIIYEPNFICPEIYQRMVIGSDGRVMLCGNDEMNAHIVGNVYEESISKIWHGKKMQKAREIHRRRAGVNEINICKYCQLPRKTETKTSKVKGKKLKINNFTNREQTIGK